MENDIRKALISIGFVDRTEFINLGLPQASILERDHIMVIGYKKPLWLIGAIVGSYQEIESILPDDVREAMIYCLDSLL
jgi:hypothetical protein